MLSPKCVLIPALPLLLLSCGTAIKTVETGIPTSEAAYMLPTSRPSDAVRDQLIAQLEQRPDDAVLHRDLGSLFQSRVMRVQAPERWELIRKALNHLERAQVQLPEDPQILVFLGLARASSARLPETNILAKMTRVLEGFSLMDRAVDAYPNNFSLRLIRAKAELAAPAILGRGKKLREDYALLEERITSDKMLPQHLAALGYLFMGDFYHVKKEPEKARELWQKALDLDTSYKGEAQDRMDGVEVHF